MSSEIKDIAATLMDLEILSKQTDDLYPLYDAVLEASERFSNALTTANNKLARGIIQRAYDAISGKERQIRVIVLSRSDYFNFGKEQAASSVDNTRIAASSLDKLGGIHVK